MTMSQDLFSSLKNYANKLSNGEKTPAEIAAALNVWLKDSGDSIKEKIEFEVSQSVAKLGFAKQSDLDKLQNELNALKASLNKKNAGGKTTPAKKKTVRKPVKKATKRTAR
jgi:hypothetical protein